MFCFVLRDLNKFHMNCDAERFCPLTEQAGGKTQSSWKMLKVFGKLFWRAFFQSRFTTSRSNPDPAQISHVFKGLIMLWCLSMLETEKKNLSWWVAKTLSTETSKKFCQTARQSCSVFKLTQQICILAITPFPWLIES